MLTYRATGRASAPLAECGYASVRNQGPSMAWEVWGKREVVYARSSFNTEKLAAVMALARLVSDNSQSGIHGSSL